MILNGKHCKASLQALAYSGQKWDIGIFYLNGDAYIKKYQKNKDHVQLISLNKKYAPIQIKLGMELRTFGKVVK